jgi:hypothetical protein
MLDYLVLQQEVQKHIGENSELIELATTKEHIEKVVNNSIYFVKENLDIFVVSDNPTKTYENIKNFSESNLINYFENSADIINDITSSDYLKRRLLEAESYMDPYIYDPGNPKSANRSDRGERAAAWGRGKAEDWSNSTKRRTGEAIGHGQRKAGEAWGSERAERYKGKAKSGSWWIIKWSLVLGLAGSVLNWLTSTKKLYEIDINAISKSNFKEKVSGWFDWMNPFSDDNTTKSTQYNEALDEWKEKLSDIRSEIESRLSRGINVERDNDLRIIEDELKLARDKLAEVDITDINSAPELSTRSILSTLDSKRDDVAAEIQSQLEMITNQFQKIEADKTMGPITRAFASLQENGGIIAIGLLIPALLYIGAIKYKDFIKIKLFDYKLDKYTRNLSRLGFSQVEELKEKAKVQRGICESSIRKEDNKIKIDETLACYVKYSSTIILLIMGALIESNQKVGVNMNGVKTIDQLININDGRQDKAINEIATNAYRDYKQFIFIAYNSKDKNISKKIINELNNGLKQFKNINK